MLRFITIWALGITCRLAIGEGFSLEDLETVLKSDPTNKPLVLEVARRYHQLLLDEPGPEVWKKAKRTFDLLDQQFRITKQKLVGRVDTLALALLGSYRIMHGEQLLKTKSRFKKQYVETFLIGQGTADLDMAVAMEPKNLEVLLIRAKNGYAYQGTGRLEVSINDLRRIVIACENDPRQGAGINVPDLYLFAGRCARGNKDFGLAHEIWTMLGQKYPASPEAEQAQIFLKEIDRDVRKERFIIKRFLLPQDEGKEQR